MSKEKIYTIPVNDAFETDCECPICSMFKKLEDDAVSYTMGPSYMEDDIRAMTDQLGFCEKHLKRVYDEENRLGFALVMKTHLDKVISDIEQLSQEKVSGKAMFKKVERPSISAYTKKITKSCFVCSRVENTFARYMDTIVKMYKKDATFREKYKASKGFCTRHYGMLIEEGSKILSGKDLEDFVATTNGLYIDNMRRVRDDVEWFINKFDHKYADEPWKNARDSLTRAMTKDESILPDEPKKK